jgi:hypothetical protein
MKRNYLLPIIALFIFSCKKNNVTESVSAIDRLKALPEVYSINPYHYFRYIRIKMDAEFYISAKASYNAQIFNKSQINCGVNDNTIDRIFPSSINNVQLAPNNQWYVGMSSDSVAGEQLKTFFGTTAKVEVNYRVNGRDYSFKYNLPVTEGLKLPEQDISQIFPGKTIKWIPSQPEGDKSEFVVISIGYDPDYPGAGSNVVRGGIRTSYKNIILNDSGSYTLTSEDLKEFPDRALLLIDIYRGNIIITKDENSKKRFMLGSYTVVMFDTNKK